MFEYVNLLIIELLMMKLHVHDMYKWVQPLLASGVCTLKRIGGRLSVRAQL